ncbi:NitT/TauT family transport system substrate-binding protein [Roseomonas rosea]|jgi:NitT/TauT family transport system substrate-binding protein|uniref:Thiamine pyrimidine synthase n=1 Tax=Muricoccus roseus TaxID=198092 RepID=A0A1M6F1M7_9PROT|nr:ABC transporter substrate-binding protein [Roseomonas rosea]SHI91628.1 NitT/TauT family transport system substrate-binding protein [Roseomonas rosea]
MRKPTRRGVLGAALAAPFLAPPSRAQGLTPLRFILDWKAQGPHAWYYLAQSRGYFREAGLDVTIDQGEGSAAAVTRVMSGAYDAGFGDINAVIQNAAQRPGEQPVMVYLVYNRAPYAIIARADGPVRSLKDLEGRQLGAPAGSATARMFPALAARNGVDPAKVRMAAIQPNLVEQMLVQGQVDAIAQFSGTSYMNFVGMGRDPEKDFRWFFYSDMGLDQYSNGVLVSQALLRNRPEAVRGLVAAINRAIRDVAADPDAGIAELKRVEPLTDPAIEKRRMLYMLRAQMTTPETEALGLGDLDDRRLEGAMATVVQTYGLSRTPAASEVFRRDFLPAREARRLPALAG